MGLSEKLVEINNKTVSMLNVANNKTGANDTSLSNAIQTLIDGFGTSDDGGALPSGIEAIDFGDISIASDFTTSSNIFTHKLGVVPDFMMVWAKSNVAQTYSMLCAIRGSSFGWRNSNYNSHMAYHGNSTTNVSWTNSNSSTYGISNMTSNNFKLASSSSSCYWRSGRYNYMAIKFK